MNTEKLKAFCVHRNTFSCTPSGFAVASPVSEDDSMSKGGRPKSQNKMTHRLNTSVEEGERHAFREACKVIGVEPAHALRELASAFVLHVETHKSATLPFRIVAPRRD